MLNHTRQLDIFNPSQYSDMTITIVGCGAIGSAVSEALVRVGMRNFVLIDDDTVEDHNLPNQLYYYRDLGLTKTEACKGKLLSIDPDLNIETINERLDENSSIDTPIVVMATDNMEARNNIYNICKGNDNVKIIIDGRMGGNVFNVYTVNMEEAKEQEFYESNLFSDSEGTELRCTERSIIYNIFGISSLMVNQLRKALTETEYDNEIMFDFETMTLVKGRA